MAATDSIREPLRKLETLIAQTENLAHCFSLVGEAAGPAEPPWVQLFSHQVLELTAAADEFVIAFNQNCYPLLKDMERIHK